jgi:hypothetical protein
MEDACRVEVMYEVGRVALRQLAGHVAHCCSLGVECFHDVAFVSCLVLCRVCGAVEGSSSVSRYLWIDMERL